jgi:hypothetical protein
MSTTVGTLEKKVETVFENLTPAERAKYVYDETWRIADEHSKGIDEESHQKEIERFFHRHVATLSAGGYIEFLIAEDKLNTGKWAGMYFTSKLTGYDREDCLLLLLIDYMHLVNDLFAQSCKKRNKEYSSSPARDEVIADFQKKRAEIVKEAAIIWKDGLWERWNIPRPELSPEFMEAIEADNEPSE